MLLFALQFVRQCKTLDVQCTRSSTGITRLRQYMTCQYLHCTQSVLQPSTKTLTFLSALVKRETREKKSKVLCFEINFQFKKKFIRSRSFPFPISKFIPDPTVSTPESRGVPRLPAVTRGKNIPGQTSSLHPLAMRY